MRPVPTLVLLTSSLLLAALVAPSALAFHDACPASGTTVTLRVGDGGFYLLGSSVYQETNGHSGLQQGALPEGCAADTLVA